jgi:hypothetical protein
MLAEGLELQLCLYEVSTSFMFIIVPLLLGCRCSFDCAIIFMV